MLDHMVRAQRRHALDFRWKRPPWDVIKPQEFKDSTLHAQLYKAGVVESQKRRISRLMANTESWTIMARHHFSFQVWKWPFQLFIFYTKSPLCLFEHWQKIHNTFQRMKNKVTVAVRLFLLQCLQKTKQHFLWCCTVAFLRLNMVLFCSLSSSQKKNTPSLRIYFVLFWYVNFPKKIRKKARHVIHSVCISPFPHHPFALSVVIFARRTCKDKEGKCDDMKGKFCCVKKPAITL